MHKFGSHAFERLKGSRDRILKTWLARTRAETNAAGPETSPALIDSLPLFIDALVDALDPKTNTTDASLGNTLSIEHGNQRANLNRYTLDQVMNEYRILQDVILETLDQGQPLSTAEYGAIARSFSGATQAAASAFMRALDEKYEESEIQYKKLIQDARDMAIFFLTPDGIIRTWNEGATRIKQFTAEDAIGHHFRMLYREEDRREGRPEHNLAMVIENGRHEEQWWRIRKDGTWWWAEAILNAVYSHDGKLVGISKMVRDLTERKRIDDELREAKARAEEASQLKNTFVANMSHEIRTPLSAILGSARVLNETSLTAQERELYATIIDRNGKVLLRLIDDILDTAKIEAGKLEMQITRIPMRALLSEVVAMFEERAQKKGLILDLMIDAEVPEYITTDPVRVRQILSNLLSNSVKFTERGGIRILAHPSDDPSPQQFVEIFVTDTGPGLPSDKLSRIFGEFSQADASVTRKYGGTGLGLALSRKLARELKGDLELLDCAEGLGCTFKFKIADRPQPFAEREKMEIEGWKATQRDTSIHPHIKGSRILLVEDSPDNQLLIKRMLAKAGAIVETAKNGREGVEKASHDTFDLVIMDSQMPILDGNHATRELRRLGFETPIVALTAHAMKHDRVESLEAGCNDYLTKPVDAPELLNIVERWVSQSRH